MDLAISYMVRPYFSWTATRASARKYTGASPSAPSSPDSSRWSTALIGEVLSPWSEEEHLSVAALRPTDPIQPGPLGIWPPPSVWTSTEPGKWVRAPGNGFSPSVSPIHLESCTEPSILGRSATHFSRRRQRLLPGTEPGDNPPGDRSSERPVVFS